MAEHGPGLLTLQVVPAGVAEVVAERCGVAEVSADVADLGFSVPRAAHEAMGDALEDEANDAAVRSLRTAGASPAAAEAFVDALVSRRRAMAVQVALNVGTGDDGPFEAAEVRWVVGPDATAWRLVVELSDEDGPADDLGSAPSSLVGADMDDEVYEARLAAVVHTIERDALHDAIRDALTPTVWPETTGDDR
ncbi:MAG: hypothetical protein ACR2MB_00645 [Acidimicrobiales bacterium]